MRSITRYQSFDGIEFDSADACRAHEAQHIEMRLVGLTQEQVRAAMAREDTELADIIEEMGKRCAASRREAGDLRRKPKQAEGPAPAQTSPEPAAEDAVPAVTPERESSHEARGRQAFLDGICAIIPDDLQDDKAAGEQWLMGWSYESLASGKRHAKK